MATSYTDLIAEKENCTLEEYAMRCARRFGALIEMMEEPLDAPIPEKFEPSTHNRDMLVKDKAKYAKFMALTDEEKYAELERSYNEMVAEYSKMEEEENEKRRILRERYEAMLEKVRAWNPPTPDHENLRDFMISQLEESIVFDCDEYKPIIPKKEEWCDVQSHINLLKRNIDISQEHYDKEIISYNKRNQWLSDLRESLKGLD